MADKSVCKIEGCGKGGRITRGLCSSHYHRLSRHGDPLAGRTPKGDVLSWIERVALTHRANECLIWPFYRRDDGRAGINMGDGESSLAHHHICEMAHGPAPSPDHIACHDCGNGHGGCVSPGHVYWGTNADNSADMIAHGRSTRGEKQPTSKLTEDDVRAIRKLAGSMIQREIAEKFGVHIMTVNDILHRRRWAWLE
ncbi:MULTISPECIES: HNH endonuclease [Mesorhizobium]|nr:MULTISPECIES: HNH endonuclease [Mesorhizobium]ETA72337.1 hypothetical protein MesloDRAFT_1207 [Mesorhizobium japonicum R7A]MBE1709668.1 hypothetical protein [Mesorhizobium japonicum]MBE1714337.1 hypothetical protein [Mesorhizobium japonicum]MUT25318.1 hypothetical protein [Mesorhizobium japonicum]MUT28628.1 hypothetical protein [Mesorhizobium japonicum]